MTALPTTNTARLVCHYTWRDHAYSTLFRFGVGVSADEAIAAVNELHATIWEYMGSDAVVTSRGDWYAIGSHVSVPVDTAPIAAGALTPADGHTPDALQWQFLGRDAAGRRASWYWQGWHLGVPSNLRLAVGDEPSVAAVTAALQYAATIGLCTIGLGAPLIKPYANVVVNDYLTHKYRG